MMRAHGCVWLLGGAAGIAGLGGCEGPSGAEAGGVADEATACPAGMALVEGGCETDLQILVPAGSGFRGCDPSAELACAMDGQPRHRVDSPAFLIDRTEVTVAAYAECVEAGPCAAPQPFHSYCNWGRVGAEDHPINCVNWSEARSFCAWRGARLPSEAEWEKAARGGCEVHGADCEHDTPPYPWGDDAPTCELAAMMQGAIGCGTMQTLPVGAKPRGKSPYGAEDMAGNVWEWVEDCYHVAYDPARDGTAWVDACGPTPYPVVRGGGIASEYEDLLAHHRSYVTPGQVSLSLGFRCAGSILTDGRR